jgi:hypothetical protein
MCLTRINYTLFLWDFQALVPENPIETEKCLALAGARTTFQTRFGHAGWI